MTKSKYRTIAYARPYIRVEVSLQQKEGTKEYRLVRFDMETRESCTEYIDAARAERWLRVNGPDLLSIDL